MWREKILEIAMHHILDDETKFAILDRLKEFDVLQFTETKADEPYITGFEVRKIKTYNPNYGDDKICECGHSYYRHFDSYEDMEDCGCKYCPCRTFVEKQEEKEDSP